LGEYSWTPATIGQALRVGSEIASYQRAATTFVELTQVPMSKSSLQRLVGIYGGELVKQQAAEAQAIVQVPSTEEVEVEWRQRVLPPSETMSLSHDGVMIHLRTEGWKEVKMVSVTAVTSTVNPQSGAIEVTLSEPSYRAGLWEVASFTNQQWAEAERRGVPQAKRLVCVADGAAWIWQLVWMCFAPCFEILDWWHATQRLWTMANAAFDTPAQAADWVEQQKQLLAHSHLRQVFTNLRLLYPRGRPLPEPVRQAVAYLFHHRRRLRYGEFRQAGLPIGSGAVESACKVVVQARLKQAGMRWSRNGAQALLALRCALLSDRWRTTCQALALA
jgi:hypothetical protein